MKCLIPALLAALLLAGCASVPNIEAAKPDAVPAGGAGTEAAKPETASGDAANTETAKAGANTEPAKAAGEDVSGAEEQGSAVLYFSSFDGGGHEYSVEIEDPSILSCESVRDYGKRDELEDGSPYRQVFTFTGLKPGTTSVAVYGRSPIMENDDSMYTATVDEKLGVTLESVRKISTMFLYRNGSMFYNSYNLSHWQDGYHVSVNDEDEQLIDTEAVDALMKVIDEYDVASWDGFNESTDYVFDGEGFWLEITLTDGTSIQARGDNAFPDNYFPAISEMQDILDNAELTPGASSDFVYD